MKINHLFALATLCGIVGNVSAVTLIQDTFSADAASINGRSPDIGPAWESSSNWGSTSGSLSVASSSHADIQGFSLLPNDSYVLSMDLNVTSGNRGWIGFGFLTPDFVAVNDGAVGGLLVRNQNSSDRVQIYSNGPISAQALASTGAFPKTVSVELETGASLSNSTLTWKIDGTQIGSPRSVDASNVDGIFLQSNGGIGIVDNFTLSGDALGPAVPEPSSSLLLGLAGLGIAFRRRR